MNLTIIVAAAPFPKIIHLDIFMRDYVPGFAQKQFA